MTIYLTPMFGPPCPTDLVQRPIDLVAGAAAASRTLELLAKYGLEITYTRSDLETAGEFTRAYAEDPAGEACALSNKRIDNMTPAALRALDVQLKKFSHNIIEDASQVRNYVTNKLIEESENPDPRIRIKALELLGKISDVGLFAEKREVTVTHKSNDELRDALRQKLSKLVNVTPAIEEAEIVETPVLTVDALDAAWDEEDE